MTRSGLSIHWGHGDFICVSDFPEIVCAACIAGRSGAGIDIVSIEQHASGVKLNAGQRLCSGATVKRGEQRASRAAAGPGTATRSGQQRADCSGSRSSRGTRARSAAATSDRDGADSRRHGDQSAHRSDNLDGGKSGGRFVSRYTRIPCRREGPGLTAARNEIRGTRYRIGRFGTAERARRIGPDLNLVYTSRPEIPGEHFSRAADQRRP